MKIQLGFFTLLGLLFIALKLTGYITWSWWLVTLPLWFGWAVLGVLFLLGVAAMIAAFILSIIVTLLEG
jgi:hypothetical protein